MDISSEIQLQRDYYARTAGIYEDLHVQEDDEHYFALAWMAALIRQYGYRSVLDVGAGTGRGLVFLKDMFPGLRVVGVEPSPELRQIGHSKGLSQEELIDGDALNLVFADSSFDLVCEFGVLHHVKYPRRMLGEMLRVSGSGLFISDDNHFACGSNPNQMVKRFLRSIGLWRAAYWLRTGGKCYAIGEGDGLSYAYSVFDDYEFIRERCKQVHMVNTSGVGADIFRSAGNVALFGRKKANSAVP
jgi:ubiquinone/menaquinone biosynthesis C-methylase UbiE